MKKILKLAVDHLMFKICELARKRAVKAGGTKNLFVPANDLIGLRIFSTGFFERREMEGLEEIVFPNIYSKKLALDIGANIGLYTIKMSSVFDQVVSFEANPITFLALEANLKLCSIENTQLFPLALSDQSGYATLHIPNNGNLGWATLRGWDMPGGSTEMTVKTKTLDSIFFDGSYARVGFVKIDVEGAESKVLTGGKNLLERDKPVVFIECNSPEEAERTCAFLRTIEYKTFNTLSRGLFGKVNKTPLNIGNCKIGSMILCET